MAEASCACFSWISWLLRKDTVCLWLSLWHAPDRQSRALSRLLPLNPAGLNKTHAGKHLCIQSASGYQVCPYFAGIAQQEQLHSSASSAFSCCRAQHAARSRNLPCAFCLQEQLRVQKVQQSKAKLQSKDRKVRSAQRERRRLRALLGQDIPDDLLQSAGEGLG